MSGVKTNAYKPYPSYKTSGASWLGELPTQHGEQNGSSNHVDEANASDSRKDYPTTSTSLWRTWKGGLAR